MASQVRASQVRYFVRFESAVGIYRAGDEAALSAAEYAREAARRPAPLVTLLYEQHEELGENGQVIAGSVKRVEPPPAPPAPAAGEVGQLRAENEKLKARIAELEGDKAPKKKG